MINKTLAIAVCTLILPCLSSAVEVSVKGSSLYFDYMEYGNNGQYLDSERADFGNINGIDVAIRFGGHSRHNGINIINDVWYSYLKGNTAYVGSDLNNPNGQYGDISAITKDKLVEYGYKTGFSAALIDNVLFGGQIGLSNRSWERALADSNTENYEWPYWSAGLRMDWITTEGDLSVHVDYQKAINPTMSASSPSLRFSLGETKGYKIGVDWHAQLTREIAFETSYMYDYWEIGRSNTVYSGGSGYYEPRSQTNNHIIEAGFALKF